MYYVYLLVNPTGRTYLGYTSDLKRRLAEHNSGIGQSNKWGLCYYEAYRSESDARRREKALKQSSQARRWLKERTRESRKLRCKS
jgi:putative endonuclease